VAPWTGGSHVLALGVTAPVRRSGDATVERRASDEQRVVPVALASTSKMLCPVVVLPAPMMRAKVDPGAAEICVVVTAAPAAAAGENIATLEAASGRLTVLRLGQPQTLTPSMTLQLNDVIVTREGRATVRFLSDGTVLRIGPDSRVQVDEQANQREVTVLVLV